MKNTILKSIFALFMGFMALPMMSQNYLKIYFKDGHTERHFMRLVNNISMSKYDLEGNLHSDYQMQQIVMPDTTYSYYLADIDSMTFRKVDEEKVKKDIKTVITSADSILQSCQTVEEIQHHLEEISKIEGVESAKLIPSGIVVLIRDSYKIYYYIEPEPIDDNGQQNSKPKLLPPIDKMNKATNSVSNSEKPIKIALANAFHDDFPRINQTTALLSLDIDLKTLGFDSKYFDYLDLSFFANTINEYDHVILFTHGTYDSNPVEHNIVTNVDLNNVDLNDYLSEQVKNGIINENDYDIDDFCYGKTNGFFGGTYYHLAVSEKFIQKRISKRKHNSPSIIFSGACGSLEGHEFIDRNVEPFTVLGNKFMSNAFINKKNGFDIYIGYNKSNIMGILGGVNLFRNMLNGQSEEVAFANILPIYLYDHSMPFLHAYLIDVCNDNDSEASPRKKFIVETKTKELSPIDILDYSVNGKIRLTGYTTMLDPFLSTVKCGFLYNIDGQNFPVIQCSKEYNMLEIKKDNVSFSATIDLKKGQKLEYQAFTYDGVNYNWGEQRSFIDYDEISLSTNSVSINVGETSTIDITAGSGSYSIEKIEPEGVVTASINENHITIEAHRPGTAIITIKDDKSGQEAKIEVTVTYIDIPAEPINLGLPSGTLWASYNVGAFAREDYGHYFAWGETTEKDVYNESTYEFCKNGSYTDIGDDIGGTKFDVAHMRWGDNWMMPNKDMVKELYENCTSKWTTQNGVYGTEFTGPNGATIFLPAAGCRKDDQLVSSGVWGDYWSSSASRSYTYSAYELYFKDGLVNCDYIYNDNPSYRISGRTVRPVIPGLFLSSTVPFSILEGRSKTITVVYGSGNYGFEVDKEGIVSVNINGSTITITGEQVGNVIVTIKDSNGNKANISVAVNAVPVMKDLGLPSGTKWASFNIGSNNPEDFGNYYAWGDSEVKEAYNVSTYEHCKNGVYAKIGNDIRGTQYDTAREIWGGEWMMPSTAQFNELINNCTSKWGTLNGVYGKLFTSKINGESIFFPAAGYHGNNVGSIGEYGYYWSGNLSPDDIVKAYNLAVKNGNSTLPVNSRYFGFTIRPVISGLELSTKGSLYIFEGNSETITIKSGSGSYDYSVDNEGIVSVSVSGSTITINALKIGDVIFTVTDTQGGQKTNITVNVRAIPEIIDLGLPSGTKWANINVGANNPEEYGHYYAWGETEVKSKYNTSTYHHYKNSSYVDVDYDIRGSEYDVAHVKWGSNWMMPSYTQMNELIDNCTSEWTAINGVYGYKFISKINGNSIFMPAVGYCENGVSSSGENGYYWTCSSKAPDSSGAYSLYIKNNAAAMNHYYRYYGFAVRPVIREKSEDADPRMEEVISEIVIDKLRDHLPIYSGMNPPNIEGSYLITPYTTVFCEDGNWEPGHVISDYKIRFFNQSHIDNTIDMIDYNANNVNSYSKGTGAFISGNDDHFTAFFNTEGFSQDIFTKMTVIVSGTKTADGIKDLYYGFVMEEKGNDPDHKLMDTGVYRIFKDGDGISEPTSWEFENSSNQMKSKAKADCETMEDGRKSLKAESEESKRIE